jgi:ApbE superfamily uncharacterized protein (UPF0280 family)
VNQANDAGPVQVLADDLILVDWGPMTMTLSVWDLGDARPVIAVQAAWSALMGLRVLADFHGFLRLKVESIPKGRPLPSVVERAFRAARSISGDLSSLAAVAGATADEAADIAAGLGASKVIVNNGGDIALRLGHKSEACVGVKAIELEKLLGSLKVRGDQNIGGVATSGWAGRSHSPGVADLVTVWAESAALADAAATLIAAKTTAKGSEIKRARARDLDHASDLGDSLVTSQVGDLSQVQRFRCLERGAETADMLLRRDLIRGCFIYVQCDSFLMDPERIMSSK